jgi:hypothetical protein
VIQQSLPHLIVRPQHNSIFIFLIIQNFLHHTKPIFFAKKAQFIWSVQKKVVPLHAFSALGYQVALLRGRMMQESLGV